MLAELLFGICGVYSLIWLADGEWLLLSSFLVLQIQLNAIARRVTPKLFRVILYL